jgi:hypothetical protein
MRLNSIKANLDDSYTITIENDDLMEEFIITFSEIPEIDSVVMYMSDLHRRFDSMSKFSHMVREIIPLFVKLREF